MYFHTMEESLIEAVEGLSNLLTKVSLRRYGELLAGVSLWVEEQAWGGGAERVGGSGVVSAAWAGGAEMVGGR